MPLAGGGASHGAEGSLGHLSSVLEAGIKKQQVFCEKACHFKRAGRSITSQRYDLRGK